MNNIFSKVTLDIIGVSAFGYDFKSLVREDDTLYLAFASLVQGIVPLATSGPLMFLRRSLLKNMRTNAATLRKKVLEIIRVYQDEEKQTSGQSLLHLILRAKDESQEHVFNEEEAIDHITTFLGAGHETTAVALSWTIYLLAQHPEVLPKIQQELASVLEGRLPASQDLSKLVYLEAVVKESLRLYPPAPTTSRMVKTETTMNGYKIPAGTICVVSPYVMGRLPSLWDEPEVFRPERWLEKKKISSFAWLPFLVGNHACIGQRFAMLELVTILSIFLRHFQFELSSEDLSRITPKLGITQRPYPGMFVTLRKRV